MCFCFFIHFYVCIVFKCGRDFGDIGTCKMEYGDTKVHCSVSLEHETEIIPNSLMEMRCEVKFTEPQHYPADTVFTTKNIGDMVLRSLARMIKIKEMPRCPLNLSITIKKNDGCAISTAITCASLAILDAGIPSHGLMVASTTCFLAGKIVVNPQCKYTKPALIT